MATRKMAARRIGHLGGVLKDVRPGDAGPTFPNRDYVSTHSYNELSDAGRRVYESRVQKDIDRNPFIIPMVIPGRIIQNVHAAVYDALGGKRAVDKSIPSIKKIRNTGNTPINKYKSK